MGRKASRCVGKFTLTHRSHKRAHHHHHHHHHHQPRPTRTIMTRSQSLTSGSFFDRLPSVAFDMILDKLTVLEISEFSIVSKEITKYVVGYISTLAWKEKNIIQSFHNSTCLEQTSTIRHYRDLGLLFKRCTLLLPTKDRLKFIFSKFSQSIKYRCYVTAVSVRYCHTRHHLMPIPCFLLEQCVAPDCIGFSSYGVFLQTLVAGWDEVECHRVFTFLCDHTNLLQKIEAVIKGKPGMRWYQKLQLRLFCRQVLVDPWKNHLESHFWLTQLLKPWPLVFQAHLLLILYGPLLHQYTFGWQDLMERELPHYALWDLAQAIILLCGKEEVKGQTTNTLLAIFEELIVIPQPWHVENVARLLVLCGSSLCFKVLASKAVNGRLVEVSRLIVYIILVCEKDGYHMTWAAKMVQQICKVFSTIPERFSFIQHLESMFSAVTRELFPLTGNHVEDRESLQALCILQESSAHFHTKFLQMLL